MYAIFDDMTETFIGPFNDYESAQMFLLHASEDLIDGGESLTIEAITDPMEWVQQNSLSMAISL